MNNKKRILLEYLLENNAPLTSKQLAGYMNVSDRTIKTYVKDMNLSFTNIISVSSSGYIINRDNIENIEQLLITDEKRTNVIITKIIQEKINFYDLCEILFISESTLTKELKKISKFIAEFDLKIEYENDNIFISGLESNKRTIFSSLLYDESNTNFLNLEKIQHNFKDIDVIKIHELVSETFHQYKQFVNDYSLIYLILHITISIDRIQHGNTFETEKINLREYNEYNIAKRLGFEFSKYFNIDFNEYETDQLCLLLLTRTTSIDYSNININDIAAFVDQDIITLVEDILISIDTLYYVKINDSDFMVRFILHINNLLERLKYNKPSKNPLKNEIKKSCPLIYDVSVFIASKLELFTNIKISEDEITYIALHIGSFIESQNSLDEKLNVVFICPNYYNYSLIVIDKIKNRFENDIIITNVLNTYIDNISCDFILTTIPILNVNGENIVKISPFLNSNDIDNITKMIDTTKVKRDLNLFKDNISNIFSKKLFKIISSVDKDDILKNATNVMQKLGYAQESFYDRIQIREKMSSTSFNGFAIPHALEMNEDKTGIYVAICKKSILWDKNSVNIILILCFNKHDRYLFNQVFESLTLIFSEYKNIEMLKNVDNYDEFIDKVLYCYNKILI